MPKGIKYEQAENGTAERLRRQKKGNRSATERFPKAHRMLSFVKLNVAKIIHRRRKVAIDHKKWKMNTFIVYRITNIRNGRIYIGSTSQFEIRKSEHFGQLRNNKHVNWKLQYDFKIYGHDAFVMEIIKDGFESRQLMLLCEYEMILKLPKGSYNIDKNCPVEGIHNKKNKSSNSKKQWKAHLKWKKHKRKSLNTAYKIKIDHPALDQIALNKMERDKKNVSNKERTIDYE